MTVEQEAAPRCVPPHRWPQTDQHAWAAALASGDILDPGGPASRWSPFTRRKVAKGYGRWLAWLEDHELLVPSELPAARLSPQRVHAYLQHLRGMNAESTVYFRIHELDKAMRVLAPEIDWDWLRRIEAQTRARAKPARPKRQRIVSSKELFDLGDMLMARARSSQASSPRDRAALFRDGLMIAVLAARPMRLRNLIGIRIGRQLVRRGAEYWLAFTADETKTRYPIEVPVPAVLTSAIDEYVEYYRPQLLVRPSDGRAVVTDALWISERATQLKASATNYRVNTVTRRELGKAINPHLFRDCAATSVAIDDPEHVRIIASLLGHSSLATSERHYNQAHALQALRRYQEHLVQLRQRLRRKRGQQGDDLCAPPSMPAIRQRTSAKPQSTIRSRSAAAMPTSRAGSS
jgi:site-specific recombinase XerD